jgi:hypothetical protein
LVDRIVLQRDRRRSGLQSAKSLLQAAITGTKLLGQILNHRWRKLNSRGIGVRGCQEHYNQNRRAGHPSAAV